MGSLHIEQVDTKSFASVVADELVLIIQDCIEDTGSCTIALAGGSTPSGIYRLLGRPPRSTQLNWNAIKLFWGDERWVAHDDTQSNFHMTQETLLNNIDIPDANVFAVNTSADSAEVAAKEYQALLEEHAKAGPLGPVIDLVLLGIGEDGHTASLFPGSPALEAPDSQCVVATEKTDGSTRISLAPSMLKNASNVVFIVSGEAKATMLQRVLEGAENISEVPATIFRKMQGKVTWFVDSAAAKKLDKG